MGLLLRGIASTAAWDKRVLRESIGCSDQKVKRIVFSEMMRNMHEYALWSGRGVHGAMSAVGGKAWGSLIHYPN
jgi:hypothetical protein